MILEDSLWQVGPGAQYAHENKSQHYISLHKSAACSIVLHSLSVLIDQLPRAEGIKHLDPGAAITTCTVNLGKAP